MIEIKKEIISALAYFGVFIFVFIIGELVNKKFPALPELSRKTVHFIGGIVALSFPYFIQSHWTILVLAFGFASIILVTKQFGVLRSVHGVARVSHGGLYYPLAIYLIFLMSGAHQVLYFTSILVMTICDALAALIGGKYGKIKFDVEGNLKSLEGSLVFFFLTFLCVHLPLLLMTDIDRINSVLIALVIAILVTGFEAISLSGSDNIFVPFGTYYLLAKMTHYPLANTVRQIQILVFIVFIVLLIFLRPKVLKTSGIIGMILFNYAAWSLGNFSWFLPLFMAQILYRVIIAIFVHYEGQTNRDAFQIKVIFYTVIVPILIIFAANTAKKYPLFYLSYLTSIGAQAAIISEFYLSRLNKPKLRLTLFYALISTLITAGLPVLFYRNHSKVVSMLIIILGSYLACLFKFMGNKYYSGKRDDLFEYRLRAFCTALTVIVVFVFTLLWKI